jgi:hypothetical protein
MSTQTMSVTQALAELKLLDKRISKIYAPASYGYHYDSSSEDTFNFEWVAVRTKTNPVDVEQLKRSAQADWQSFTDLLARRDRMKRAIVKSNATTVVKIGSWEGTVAEAIEQKASISYKKGMLEAAKKHLLAVRERFEKSKKEVQERLDKLLQSELGKDVRTNPDTIAAITVSFLESNKVELVDPLNLATKVKQLEEEVENFQSNVDWVLSEANGRAMIEILS